MKILFIHEVSYQTKFVFEMHEFPELLAIRGLKVSFLEFPEDDSSWQFKKRLSSQKISGRAHAEVSINLITPSSFGKGIFGRLFGVFSSIPALKKELTLNRPDVIVLLAVPTTGWQTVRIANKLNIPVVFRALDVSHLLRPTVFSGLIKIAEKYIYKNATVLSANNPALTKYCVELSGRVGPSLVNLPPLDLSHFKGKLHKSILKKYGIPLEARVLMYMGTFFRFSGLEQALRDFAVQLKKHDDLYFVLVGQGEIEEQLRDLAIKLGISDHVIFTGRIDYLQLGEILRAADIALNPFDSEFLTNVALPHKVLQYMATGVPVVSTNLEGLKGVVGESSGVTWVQHGGSHVDAAIELLSLPKESRLSIGAKQQQTIDEILNLDKILADFVDTLELAIETNKREKHND